MRELARRNTTRCSVSFDGWPDIGDNHKVKLGKIASGLWVSPRALAHVLLFFHGQRYWLGDYVIMPNHIHCLVAFLDNDIAKTQPGSWMRFSAKKINQLLGSNGALWFPEPFDHLVRSENQLEYLRSYIGDNPKKAGLNKGEFTYRRSVGNF